MQKKPIELSCVGCGHLSICKIRPNFVSMIDTLFPPVEDNSENLANISVLRANDLANICGAFIPKSQLETFNDLKAAAAAEEAAAPEARTK